MNETKQTIQSVMLPNSFQVLNFYTDWLSFYMTPSEEKTLYRLIRETIGFSRCADSGLAHNEAFISFDVLLNGKTNQAGEQLCLGVGLSRSGLISSLSGLSEFGIIIKGETVYGKGTKYGIQLNAEKIDIDGLVERKNKKKKSSTKQTENAREASQLKQQLKTFEISCDTEIGLSNRPVLEPEIGLSNRPDFGLLDRHKETQIETQYKTNTNVLVSPAGLDENQFNLVCEVMRGSLEDLVDHFRGNREKDLKPQGHLYSDDQLDALMALEPDIRQGLPFPKRKGTGYLLNNQKEFNKLGPAYKAFANAGKLGLTDKTRGFNDKSVREEIEQACGGNSGKIQLLFDIQRKGLESGYWTNPQHTTFPLAWLKVGKLPTAKYPENGYRNGYSQKNADTLPISIQRERDPNFSFPEVQIGQ